MEKFKIKCNNCGSADCSLDLIRGYPGIVCNRCKKSGTVNKDGI